MQLSKNRDMFSFYYKGRNARYFFLLIAKATITEEYY